MISARDRADARRQFRQVEWLHEIVVRASIKPRDAGPKSDPAQWNYDRRGVARTSHGAQQIEAAPIGKHQVE